jgi:uncharacterized protein YggU (UPF0235/DUF167 family)
MPEGAFVMEETRAHGASISHPVTRPYEVTMARPAPAPLPPLAALLAADGTFAVRVTPRAASARVVLADGALRVYVTEPPEDGRPTEAVRTALARAFDVAKSDLVLVRGATSREKVFRLRGA